MTETAIREQLDRIETKCSCHKESIDRTDNKVDALALQLVSIEKKLDAFSKGDVFIKHIQSHLEQEGITTFGGKVICKICNKTVDEIYKKSKEK